MSAFETKDLSNELGNLFMPALHSGHHPSPATFWPESCCGDSILDQKGVADCLLREFLVRGAVAWALTVVVIVLLFVPLPLQHCGCHQWNVAECAASLLPVGAFNRIQLFLAVAHRKKPSQKLQSSRSTAAFPQLLVLLLPFGHKKKISKANKTK